MLNFHVGGHENTLNFLGEGLRVDGQFGLEYHGGNSDAVDLNLTNGDIGFEGAMSLPSKTPLGHPSYGAPPSQPLLELA